MDVAAILDAKGREVVTVDPDALVLFAVHEMTTRNIGALVVTKDGEHVLGVISERDVTRALVRHGSQLLSVRVQDVMSRPVPVCRPDESINACMAIMTRTRHRHVPVVADGVLCGLVSIGDVVKNRLEELELERNVLRRSYVVER
jgi:CBS domain-containing protein